jgi:transketolase
MRVQPNMTVIVPADAEQARKATYAAAFTGKPAYLRFAREKTPVFTTTETPFEIGKANVLWDGGSTLDAVIIACGPLLYNALVAARDLESEGKRVAVIDCHTVKPLDRATILSVVLRAGAVVTVEEHQIAGGLGSAVAELLAATHPAPIEFIGVHDSFGQSGEPAELVEHYGMGISAIREAVKRVIGRK